MNFKFAGNRRKFKPVKTVLRTVALCAAVVFIMHQNTSAGYGVQFAQYEQEMKSREALSLEQVPYYVAPEEEENVSIAQVIDVSDAHVIALENSNLGKQQALKAQQEQQQLEAQQAQQEQQQSHAPEYIWPVSGVISSGFGYRDIEVGSSNHKGIDIAADGGEIISAAKAGQVIYAEYNTGGYGYLVILQHDDGATTYYAHCSSLLVSAGQWVEQEESIACVGSTGVSTGNHCHFEVRINDEPVNPLDYLPEQM